MHKEAQSFVFLTVEEGDAQLKVAQEEQEIDFIVQHMEVESGVLFLSAKEQLLVGHSNVHHMVVVSDVRSMGAPRALNPVPIFVSDMVEGESAVKKAAPKYLVGRQLSVQAMEGPQDVHLKTVERQFSRNKIIADFTVDSMSA